MKYVKNMNIAQTKIWKIKYTPSAAPKKMFINKQIYETEA